MHSSETLITLSVKLSWMISSLPKRTSDFRTLFISGLSFNLSIAINKGRQFVLFRVAFDVKVLVDP